MNDFFPGDCFRFFASDVLSMLMADGVDVELAVAKELQRCREAKDYSSYPRTTGALSAEQLSTLQERIFLDWLHQKGRRISHNPRRVVSNLSKAQSIAYAAPLADIHRALCAGTSVSDRASRNSGWGSDLKFSRRDDLWKLWQITHLHLSSGFDLPDRRLGSRQVLLVHVDAHQATFLDIVPHDFTVNERLLSRLFDARPDILQNVTLRGAVPERDLSMREAFDLGRRGVNTCFRYKRRTIMAAGHGVMASGHALRVLVLVDDAMHAAYDYAMRSGKADQGLTDLELAFDGARLLLRRRVFTKQTIWHGKLLC